MAISISTTGRRIFLEMDLPQKVQISREYTYLLNLIVDGSVTTYYAATSRSFTEHGVRMCGDMYTSIT